MFSGRPSPRHFAVISLSIQLFGLNLSSIFCQKQQLALMKRLLRRLQIKIFQMRPSSILRAISPRWTRWTKNLNLYSGKSEIDLVNLEQSVALAKLKERVETLQGYLISESRTAKSWVQYMSYIDVIKTFIRAERTENWDEHLAATEKMLNLYVATGHFNYAKRTRLYLQIMLRLKYEFPWLHRQFKENGFHCVRRLGKYWTGLWTFKDRTNDDALNKKSGWAYKRERNEWGSTKFVDRDVTQL